MADEGTAKHQHRERTCERPAVRIELVPAEKMPDGFRVAPIETDGSLVWAVREGEMTAGLRDEFNEYLEHVIGSGLWHQNWEDGETRSPHPH